MSSDNHDVIVIGGGLAGLASTTFIARQGKRVTLIEQSQALGGRARTKQQDGFYFNIGPHALYRGGRGIEVLRELGVEPRGAMPLTSGAYAVKRGVKHAFPTGAVSMLTTGLFGLSAKIEAIRFLASLAKLDTGPAMRESLGDWVDGHISQAEVKDLLMTVFRLATYTNAPGIMSAGTAIEQLKLAFTKNVLYLDGGWQQVVDSLAEIVRAAGVRVETGAKVERVERDLTGAVKSVRLADGRVLNASTVIIASSPADAARMVEAGDKTSLARWAAEAMLVKAACLDVALGRLPRPKATAAFGIDRPLYLSVHSAVARLAPEGGALIHVAKYLPPGHSDSPESVERELEGLLDLVQPGWRDEVVHRRFLPELTVMHAMATAERGGTGGRPGPKVDDVPGLFVAGDWVGGEGLLADASLASAREAARLIAAQAADSLAAAV